MAQFDPAFESLIRNEGGYKLHQVAGDRGGMTYAGISRVMNPQWPGWAFIDRGEIPPSQLVRDFYRAGYWEPIRGDDLPQDVSRSIFDFAVNSGAPGRPTVAIKLAQAVVGTTPDGVLGPKTLAALQALDPQFFKAAYALARIARYRDIVTRDRTQQKFLLGWINRTLREAA